MRIRIFICIVAFLGFSQLTSAQESFSLRNFESCTEARTTFQSLLSQYIDQYTYPMPMYDMGVKVPAPTLSNSVAKESSAVINVTMGASQEVVSSTNTQVRGVDESDIIKTDGKTLYTLRTSMNTIEVVDTKTLAHLTSITFPEGISVSDMYLEGSRLVVIGTKYSTSQNVMQMRWYNPDIKTIVRIYDISAPTSPRLTHTHEIDGNLRASRLSGGQLYFLTQSDFRIAPYYTNLYAKSAQKDTDILSAFDKNFTLKNIVPEIRDSVPNPKNPSRFLTSIRTSVSRCEDLSFVLPSKDMMKALQFTPTFTTIASLDIRKASAKILTQTVFGDVSEIHMSAKSLYLVSSIQKKSPSVCGPNAKCAAQSYYSSTSTLVHRFAISDGKTFYKNTTEVSGNPLNQYSMDEDSAGNFRIVTSEYDWQNGTNNDSTTVSVMNPLGKVVGSLKGIAKGENFQSSRFIGNRLYLVTFQQIDPLFVIDLADAKNPKILGELKIPGYSTYLHPYDQDRLIGIGYDTFVNPHGGTQNGGLKIDLYNVADIKHPVQESSLVLGDMGSTSDVLSNPRAFVWYAEKNLLLLPATLMTSAKDPQDTYRSSRVFQGLLGIEIKPKNIVEKFRVTHISPSPELETTWKKDCEQYKPSLANACVKLLGGGDYCPSAPYVPPYCYATSTVDDYLVANIWNYQTDFINRSIYIGEKFYTIAEGGVKSWGFSDTTIPAASLSFPIPKEKIYPPVIAY